jgi:tetraacyldisaccharide 4'-kinase
MNRVLRPLVLAYQAGSRINNWLFDRGLRKTVRTPLPVISVGNLAFGGSGKTPLVMQLLSYCLERGFKPALITRGYRGKWEKSGGILSDGKNTYGTWQEAGDEPFMVSRKFPQIGIYVGRNRSLSCERAKQAGFTVVILDDGFQHRTLHRDLDIVLFDPGETSLLRESISSLHRAGVIMVDQAAFSLARDRLEPKFPDANIYSYTTINKGFYVYPEEVAVPSDRLAENRYLAVCGIARPHRFFSLLGKEGIKPLASLVFSDHHTYPDSSLSKIIKVFKNVNADAVITTEKDVFKLGDLAEVGQIPVWYNRMDLQVEENFYKELSFLMKEG